MTDTPEQAQLRQHLAELRHAAGAVGKDISLHVQNLDQSIDRMGHTTGKEAKYLYWELEDDMYALARGLRKDVASIPGRVADAAGAAKDHLVDGFDSIASRTGDALSSAGKRASDGTKNAFASAAGVRRTPMKEWHTPANPPPREE
jgi:hypothetical protein